jgi:hypothetical protein
MCEIIQKNHEFSHYNTEFKDIAADLDWDSSALWNRLRMGISEEMTDSFAHCNVPEELPLFVTVCQIRDN